MSTVEVSMCVIHCHIPSVRRGVRRMCMPSPGAERGSRQAVRALDRDLVYLSLGA